MRKKDIILRGAAVAFAMAAFFSCQSVESGDLASIDIEVEPGVTVKAEQLQTGHVRLLVTDEFIESLSSKLGETRDASAQLLDNIHDELPQVSPVRLERTFPYAGKFEARTRAAGLDRWYDLYFDSTIEMSEYMQLFSSLEDVEICEYCPKVTASFTDQAVVSVEVPASTSDVFPFDDPQLPYQWHYYNDGSKSSYIAGSDINVLPVWQSIETGNPDVIVSVVDGGVDYSHEDLKDNMWVDPDFTESRAYGYNFIRKSHIVTADNHGTHVAGTIAAVNNNGIGVAGIAGGNKAKGLPGVRIMSCQIFEGEEGNGAGDVAIKWGCDHGAVISQNSWGYPTATYLPVSTRAAIDYFNTYAGLDENGNQVGPMAGGIVIFAAGNESRDWGYPAKYEGVLAVGSIGADFQKAYYSNFGDWVDIAAPGGDAKKGTRILSTLPGNDYGYMQGTSMACPHVSGVAALVVSHFGGPGFSRIMLWNRLVNTATNMSDINPNAPRNIGNLVNSLGALHTFGVIAPDAVEGFTAKPLNSNFVEFSLQVPADEDDGKAFGVNIFYSPVFFDETSSIPYKSFTFNKMELGETFTGVLSGLSFSTDYYLRAEAYDLSGNRSDLSETVTVRTSDNRPPKITVSSPLKLDVHSHETKYILFSYSDVDGHEMSPFLETVSTADTLYAMGPDKAQITITGNKAAPGTYRSTVTVLDEFDAYDSFDYEYTIYANHAPSILKAMPDVMISNIGETKDLGISEFFMDEDEEPLSITTADGGDGLVSLSVASGRLFVTATKAGSGVINVKATDASGESVEQSFRVLVRNGGDPLDIYPNPVTANLYVRTDEELVETHVTVTSQLGKVVKDVTVQASAFEPCCIDMSDCAPGVYVVNVGFSGKTYTRTIAKI